MTTQVHQRSIVPMNCTQTFRSSSVIFSALRALRHSTLCEPWRRRNSIESKPLPSDDTKMAELIRLREHRSDIWVDGSSCHWCWMCCNRATEKNKRETTLIVFEVDKGGRIDAKCDLWHRRTDCSTNDIAINKWKNQT